MENFSWIFGSPSTLALVSLRYALPASNRYLMPLAPLLSQYFPHSPYTRTGCRLASGSTACASVARDGWQEVSRTGGVTYAVRAPARR